MATPALLEDLQAGKPAALARAISMVENGAAGFEGLLGQLHGRTGRARRVGITGPPGAGKSTLIERLTSWYRRTDLTVGVVAVDPSSPFTGGALLGDRIRMERSSEDSGVFIRSMASRGSLGGMATTTGEVADVMDAFGFARILIETLGVGQSELEVASAADSTVVVLVPESGDGIQVMKAGLMEIADVFVVNKADRPGADRLRQELEVAIGLRRGQAFRHVPAHHAIEVAASSRTARGKAAPPHPDESESWEPPVILTVAARDEGVAEVAAALDRHYGLLEVSGELAARRARRRERRLREVVDRALRRWVWSEATPDGGGTGLAGGRALRDALRDVASGRVSPYEAAAGILELIGRSGAHERD